MSQPIPTVVPRKLSAGTTWQWTRRYNDVPTGATVEFFFLGKVSFKITATEVSGEWTVDVDEAVTGAYTAGTYRWEARATAGGDEWLLERGYIEVLLDASAPALIGTDQRSFNERMLEALEAMVEGTATSIGVDVQSYKIGSRELTRMNRTELLKWLNIFRMRVRMERNGGRLPPVEVRFVNA
jgi:hypothetical protein